MLMDEVLFAASESVKTLCRFFLVDVTEVPDFNQDYELYDPCTLMFFCRGRHVELELGLGGKYKLTWPVGNPGELAEIVETIHRGAQQGRDIIVASKDHALTFRY